METGQVVAVAFVAGIMLIVVLLAFRARRRNQRQHPHPAVESGSPAHLDQVQAADQPIPAADEHPTADRDDEDVDRVEVFGGPAGVADADPDPSADDIPTPPVGGHPVDVTPGPDAEDRTERLPVSAADPVGRPPDRVDSGAPTHALPVVPDPSGARPEGEITPDAQPHRHARPDANAPAVPPHQGSGGRHRAPSDGPQLPAGDGDDEEKTEPRGAQIVPDQRLPGRSEALPTAVPPPRDPTSAGHDADDVTTTIPTTDPTGHRNGADVRRSDDTGGGDNGGGDQEKPARSLADRLLGRRR